MTALSVQIVRLETHDPRLALPRHETDGAAGLDLRACLPPDDRDQGLILPSLGRALIPTGLSFAIPDGHEGQVRPRSGLAVRHGVTVINAPGTIDSDYRGEVKVPLINLGAENYRVCHGDRIAQLIIAAYCRIDIQDVAAIAATARGAGGFGSTGEG